MYLQHRNRILRKSPAIRSLVAETQLLPSDFIVPLFIDEGTQVRTEIASMPGYFGIAWTFTVAGSKRIVCHGIKSILIFVKSKR